MLNNISSDKSEYSQEVLEERGILSVVTITEKGFDPRMIITYKNLKKSILTSIDDINNFISELNQAERDRKINKIIGKDE